MIDRRKALATALTALGLGVTTPAIALERVPATPAMPAGGMPPVALPMSVPDLVQPAFREAVSRVMRQPTITARNTSGEVICSPEQYAWLLDHPDRVALAWKRLQVPCVDITELAANKFVWTDENGSEVVWQTVGRFNDGLVWYATGKVKVSPVLPTVPVKAVAVVTQSERKTATGEVVLKPLANVYLHTDSRVASVVLRMIGPTAPKLAEQGAEQLLFFFNGIANHIAKNPDQTEKLLAPAKR